jgi:hypothetical protein
MRQQPDNIFPVTPAFAFFLNVGLIQTWAVQDEWGYQ